MNKFSEQDNTIPYLKSLLLPESGPASLPDDKVARHSLRSETVTYNITSPPSGTGMIVLFPNSATELLGVHYIYDDATSKYVFGELIQTAQELSNNYNYGRKISQLIKIRSSTLPSGVYALNGVFNAVTYEGAASEVGLLPYNNILSVTSNPMDKIGNVLVGDGIAILTLPQGYDQPYVRLNDPSPTTNGTSRIRDSSDTLTYTYEVVTPVSSTTMLPPGTQVSLGSYNIDSNIGITFGGTFDVSTPSLVTKISEFTLRAHILGLSGQTIADIDIGRLTMEIGDNASTGLINANWPYGGNFLTEPIAAVSIYVETETGGLDVMNFTFSVDAYTTAFGGSTPGSCKPVTFVAYQQVAPGSAITISGIANYELIPNPALSKNLPTHYGDYEPKSLNYAKKILAHRDQVGLRTVWRLKDYQAREQLFIEMSSMSNHTPQAVAFGISDILRLVKHAAMGLGEAIIPGAGGVIKQLGDLIVSDAASGEPIGGLYSAAASGRPIGYNRTRYGVAADESIREGMDLVGNILLTGLEAAAQNENDVITDTQTQNVPVGYGEQIDRAVIFPAIKMTEDGQVMGTQLYAIVPGRHVELLTGEAKTFAASTFNGKRIFGYSGSRLNVSSPCDMTAVPIESATLDTIRVDRDDPPVAVGHSLMAAIELLKRLPRGYGVPPVVVTGSTQGGNIQPVVFTKLKREAAESLGWPLLGNTPDAAVPVTSVNAALRFIEKPDIQEYLTNGFARTVYAYKQPGKYAYCADKEALQNEWLDATKRLTTIDAEFDKSTRVLAWLEENGLVDEMLKWTEVDPTAVRFTNVLLNATPQGNTYSQRKKWGTMLPPVQRPMVIEEGRPMNATQQAQLEKAERISRFAIQQGHDFATPEWTFENGSRGPDEGQIYYYRTTGEAPIPGQRYEKAGNRIPKIGAQTGREKVVAVLFTRLGRQPTEDQIDTLEDYYNEYGKFPDAEKFNELIPATGKGAMKKAARRMNVATPARLSKQTSGKFSSLFGKSNDFV